MSENYGTSNSQFENEGTQQVNANSQNNLPEEYKPLGMWAYFGYEILFSIPIVGFIFLLVFSFGATKNINLRNFARSYLKEVRFDEKGTVTLVQMYAVPFYK